MNELFLKMVNMSMTATYLALAVILIRVILHKAPKRVFPFLWGLVALRLLFPFSIESSLSLIPTGETISPEILVAEQPAIHSGIPFLNRVVNPVITESLAPDPAKGIYPVQSRVSIAVVIWVVGVAAMLIYALISFLCLKHNVRTAVRIHPGVWKSDRIESPFVLGLTRPQIYLPFTLADSDMDYVLAHERAHIARIDHWTKPFGYLLLSLHWFNPIMWLTYILFCRDIELACDEKVIKGLSRKQRADYSQSLLTCSVPHGRITACPLAFGEIGVKERVRQVLNYKKPTFWVILAVVAASAILAVCFLTNPLKPETPPTNLEIQVSKPTETEIDMPKTVDGNFYNSEYGIAFADIDNDGKEEKCCLGHGPTSGLFTFTLAVYEGEEREFGELFYTDYCNISFLQEEDGTLKVQMKALAAAEYPSIIGELYDIVVRDGRLVLAGENEELLPSGMK